MRESLTLEENGIYEEAIKKWGAESQVLMAIEELGELIVVLSKLGRDKNSSDIYDIIEEIADVEIMIEQLKVIFKIHDEVIIEKRGKLKKLRKYLDEV